MADTAALKILADGPTGRGEEILQDSGLFGLIKSSDRSFDMDAVPGEPTLGVTDDMRLP